MTPFGWAVALAAAIAATGSLWRAGGWLRLGLPAVPSSARERAIALLAGMVRAPRGKRAWRGLTVLLLEVLGLRRLWTRDPVRWAAHLLLVIGFAGLFFLHALGDVVAVKLADSYMPTLSPWLWLRDLFGLLVLLGFAIGIARRLVARGHLPAPRRRDPLCVIALLGIVVSGFTLSAIKITSAPAFERMVREYASLSDNEATALRAYWGEEYGVAFSPPIQPVTPAQIAAGEAIHQAACVSLPHPAAAGPAVLFPVAPFPRDRPGSRLLGRRGVAAAAASDPLSVRPRLPTVQPLLPRRRRTLGAAG